MFIYQHKNWPNWEWDVEKVNELLLKVVSKQSRLLGKLFVLGFDTKEKIAMETGVLDVIKNSKIEGETLLESQIRSSIAKNLGLYVKDDGNIKSEESEGAVNMFLDSTRNYKALVSDERLFDWHAGLFPTGRSAGRRIEVAKWRTSKDPMQIVSGAIRKEKVHYIAPDSVDVPTMMSDLISYMNDKKMNPFLKAAIVHLWFEVIHPFEDGNGRIGRALVDKILCEADESELRFYSFSNSVLTYRKAYYEMINKSSKESLNITPWILWFFNIVLKSIEYSEEILKKVDFKRRFWEQYSGEKFNERQLKVIKKLLEGFEGNITSSRWTRMTKCTKMTATRDINSLLEKQILIKNDSGGRSTSYKLNTNY